MGEARAYAALIGGQFRSLMSYRLSFTLEMLSNIGTTALDIVAVVVLFSTTRSVSGFTLTEALLIVSLSSLGFALADVVVGNVDHLRVYVRTGLLDVVLVRPLGTLGQLLSMDLPFRKALRGLLSLVVLVVAVRLNDIDWTPGRVVVLIVTPIAGLVFFGAIFVLTASLAFWWVDSGEIGASFTYGGRDFTSYPMPVFAGWFRAVFAYALGFAFVSYQPALVLLGRDDPLGLPTWAGYLSPVVALVAAAVAAVVWRAGVRQYRSTGS
ncbi:ABC-2 family transporter protein [Actinoplanes sp. NPDC051633]|uniref:ABC transporter permease n=1 Tax=Actinoplanes sp. NPDC051633 TaxID=3155670 RepID=UPI00343318AD